jgi:hypothetical protein
MELALGVRRAIQAAFNVAPEFRVSEAACYPAGKAIHGRAFGFCVLRWVSANSGQGSFLDLRWLGAIACDDGPGGKYHDEADSGEHGSSLGMTLRLNCRPLPMAVPS